MNKKQKSGIILASLASIAVAGSVMTGATYALFTSESKTNIAVSSGTVDVTATIEELKTYSGVNLTGDPTTDVLELTTNQGVFTTGGTAEIVGNTLTLDKVVPGDKVTFNVKVKNNSNVAAKYRTVIQKTADDGLYEALKITLDTSTWSNGFSVVSPYETLAAVTSETEIDSIDVSIELPSDAIDDYQDKKCSIQISVEAIQGNAATSEYDVEDITLYNSDDLFLLAEYVNEGSTVIGDKDIVLTNDVVLDSTKEWTPIGKSANRFNSTFDGGNHSISGLKIDTSSGNVGLFGYVYNGTVKNLNIQDANVKSTGNAVGILAGRVVSSTIDNVTVSGTSTGGGMYTGGLIGAITSWNVESDVAVTNCINNATVIGGEQVGGIVGCAYSSHASTVIKNCVNKGNVTSNGTFGAGVGGIVGFLSGYYFSLDNKAPALINCKNTGTITGQARAGGIGGTLGVEGGMGYYPLTATFTSCENTGTVNGTITGEICDSKLHYGGGDTSNLTIIIN